MRRLESWRGLISTDEFQRREDQGVCDCRAARNDCGIDDCRQLHDDALVAARRPDGHDPDADRLHQRVRCLWRNHSAAWRPHGEARGFASLSYGRFAFVEVSPEGGGLQITLIRNGVREEMYGNPSEGADGEDVMSTELSISSLPRK